MSKLFDTTTINSLTLKNRFVRSATWEGMATEDGFCTPRLTNLMVDLARGDVGLIITGHTYVATEGQAGPWQLGVYSDDHTQGLSQMVEAVHQAGGKIVMQLAHAGCHANSELTGQEPLGPSVTQGENGPLCRAMTQEDIERTARAFEEGAARARRSGFDGVQIHAAHGYLLSQFLSPFYNRRSDQYGGSTENRARLVLDILGRIRKTTGDDYPVMIKMNSQDFVEGGLTVGQMIETSVMLEKAGIDAIELSGGTMFSGKNIPVRKGKLESRDQEVYYRDAARQYKQRIKTPLMLVGGIRSFEVAEGLIDEGLADYISLCRPLIREPHLIKRWQSGDPRRSTCRSDNLCFKPTMGGEGLYCVVEEKEKEKKQA